jgi:hypothetical protein
MTQLSEELFTVLRPGLKKKARAKKILERYWRNKIAIVWESEQVHRAANERGLALTDLEAGEVLKHLLDNHNPQSGVKWQDIYDLIEQKCLGRKLKKSELTHFINQDVVTVNSVR